ncbi:MAG: hypothetical protein QOE37_1319 [Microbacteriaceae bacterium]|nr:hypothetical protein [Microbacteriaceae bacterium]
MTDVQAEPTAAGWYPDPQGKGATRFWSGEAWTEHTKGVPQPRYAPPDPAELGATPAPTTARNPMATAGLVLGIVALLFDLLLVPTILGIVFGGIGATRAGRLGVGRARAIVGIVLAVVAIPVQAAIAIPIYLAVQDTARVSLVKSEIVNEAANEGVRVTQVDCAPGAAVRPGSRFDCTAITSAGERLIVGVTVGPDRRLAFSARRG